MTLNLRDPQERAALAGEYVLGTLAAEERRELERAAASDAALRDDIHRWERRLAPLGLRLAPLAPRPIVWLNLLHAMGPRARAPARITRTWAMLATAASMLLGVALYQQMSAPPPAPVIVTERVEVPAETYVALLAAPGKASQWTVSLQPGSRELRISASGAPQIDASHDAELWLLTDAGPVSLGLLPKSGEVRRALPAGLPSAQGRTLAVSLEPAGGSRKAGPSGPVLTASPVMRAS